MSRFCKVSKKCSDFADLHLQKAREESGLIKAYKSGLDRLKVQNDPSDHQLPAPSTKQTSPISVPQFHFQPTTQAQLHPFIRLLHQNPVAFSTPPPQFPLSTARLHSSATVSNRRLLSIPRWRHAAATCVTERARAIPSY